MTNILNILSRRRAAKLQRAMIQSEDEEVNYKPIEWPLIQRLIRVLWPFRGRYAMGVTLGMVMVVLEMMSPLYMMHIINYVTMAARSGPNLSHAAEWHVARITLAWAGTLTAALIIQRYNILIMTRTGETVQFILRKSIFDQLQRLSMSFYDRTKLGRIISRCTSDIAALREINVWGIQQVVVNLLMMIVAAIMLCLTEWRLFLSICWLGPVLYVLNDRYRTKIGFMYQYVREWFTRVSTNLAENITGMRVVTAFNRQRPNLSAFNSLQEINTVNNVNVARANGFYQPLLELIRFIGKATILIFGGYLVVRGYISKGVGAVVAAYLYWDWFMNPIINFGVFSNQLMMALAGAERVFALLDSQPEVQDLAGAYPLPRIQGLVKFDNVTFGYNPERPVLHDISFEARPGQMVALVGATGSGKSSIISLIARFYQPQKGRVMVDGNDIRQIVGKTLNKQTGLVLQANYLFAGTVMENIRYAKPDASDQQVIQAAHDIGSYDAIMMLVKGFDTEVGERGASMSLGQRQLICFTRAFLADPRIFMLDEATSAVDTATEMLVQHSLEKLLENRTTFVVAHRLSTIMRADCILIIDAGRIVERGTHQELVAAGGKYAHLYNQFVMQAE